jgi:hypothetical protein
VGGGLLIDLVENSSRSFVLQFRPEVLARWDFIDPYPVGGNGNVFHMNFELNF